MARRGMAMMDIGLVGVLIILIYVFISRMGYMSEVNKTLVENDTTASKVQAQFDGSPLHESEISVNEIGEDDKLKLHEQAAAPHQKPPPQLSEDERVRQEIDARIQRVPDSRSQACKQLNHNAQVPASIVLDFFDYQLYDLKVTVGSVMRHTPASLIKEIIVVDDGSTLAYLIKEAQTYVNFIPKGVLVRNEERTGQLNARMRGAKEANGHNIVFLDTKVIVSPGWLEPLVEHIQTKPKTIAVPHFDKVNDPVSYEYVPIKEHLVAGFSWSLSVRMRQISGSAVTTTSTQPMDSPMIHGAAFAVTKEYWSELGAYDEDLTDRGGENLELSLRTWLCGGSVHVLPCSHVGVLNVHDPIKINGLPNVWRIIEAWTPEHKNLSKSYFEQDIDASVTSMHQSSLIQRREEIKQLGCKNDIKWLLTNVAKDVFSPSPNAKHFGLLKVKNGMCARVGDDGKIDLGSCRPEANKLLAGEMMFELLGSGQLLSREKCIECMNNAYAKAAPCKTAGGDDRQVWTFTNGQIVNKWSKYCLMHVTDPDPDKKAQHRQIVMAQQCTLDTTDKNDYSNWEFVKT